MRFVEETGGLWTAEQLRAAEAEIEQQKREWEANRLAALQKEQEAEQQRQDEDELLTYSREDAKNQVTTKSSKSNSKYLNNHRATANSKRRRTAPPITHSNNTKQPISNNTKTQNNSKTIVEHGKGHTQGPPIKLRRMTSRSTVSNHSAETSPRRIRRRSLAKRSPSVAPSSTLATKRLRLSNERTTNDDESMRMQLSQVERNAKARAMLLTKNRREAAVKRRMLLHKNELVPATKVKQDGKEDSDSQSNDVPSKTDALNDDDDNLEEEEEENENDEHKEEEEEDSSECSLDAMYDSIDDDDQSEATKKSDDKNKDDDEEEEEYIESEKENADHKDDKLAAKKQRRNRTTKVLRNGKAHQVNSSSESNEDTDDTNSEMDHNQLDINSPRSTRSRGTVKLNLWTLDVSPILPDCKSNKRRSKTNEPQPPTDRDPLELPAASSQKSNNKNISSVSALAVADADDSSASVGSNNATPKRAIIRDGFSKLPIKSTPASQRKKTVATKGGAPKTDIPVVMSKHNTLDKWISKSPRTVRALSPMVVLNKDAVTKLMHPSPLSNHATAEQGLSSPERGNRRHTRSNSVLPHENGQT